jgi:hypothetical protein
MIKGLFQTLMRALQWNKSVVTPWFLVCCGAMMMGCAAAPKPELSPVQPNPPEAEVKTQAEKSNSGIASEQSVVIKPQPPIKTAPKPSAPNPANTDKKPQIQKPASPRQNNIPLPEPVLIDRAQRTGNLENRGLTEVSGLSASRNSPGVLYAINDSGDSATLYALGETGQHIGQWAITARNRDWEDLETVELNNQNYVLIGDTGDNLRVHRKSTFYLVEEPLPGQLLREPLAPYMTIDFTYEDGPRNVEAFAVLGRTIFMVSKEPLSSIGPVASRLYALEIPASPPVNTLTAKFLTQLPVPRTSLESKLAASFAGVDLNHITAMDMTSSGRSAYLLTYRQILRVDRKSDESWTSAFQRRGERIHTHSLGQAEALAIAPGRAVFITSEKRGAPLWSVPIQTAP